MCSPRRSEHNKARVGAPGRLSAQPWCRPEGVGRSCASGLAGNGLIVADQRNLLLWAELLALAPGARCQVGWFLVVRGT